MTTASEGALRLAGSASPLRHVARRYVTGVTIVGVFDGAGAHALTANSFVTLSLEPPLVSVAVRTDGRFRPLVERAGWFGVSVLGASQQRYATHYANRDRNRDRNREPAAAPLLVPADAPVAVPVVPGCLGHFVCAVESIRPVGDHDLVIGKVWACETAGREEDPLIFFDGHFHT